jgi:hypothetical protein
MVKQTTPDVTYASEESCALCILQHPCHGYSPNTEVTIVVNKAGTDDFRTAKISDIIDKCPGLAAKRTIKQMLID